MILGWEDGPDDDRSIILRNYMYIYTNIYDRNVVQVVLLYIFGVKSGNFRQMLSYHKSFARSAAIIGSISSSSYKLE